MNRTELYCQWLQEEDAARMKGWDFSHLRGRYEEEQDLPWDYAQVVRAFLQPDRKTHKKERYERSFKSEVFERPRVVPSRR